MVLIRIGFHQSPGGKLRPAVVLLDSNDDDFVAAPVTSRGRVSGFDLPIREWRQAGLNVASAVRVHKLTVLGKGDVLRQLGELSAGDRSALAEVLSRAFSMKQ